MVVYNLEDFYNSDTYRDWLDELLEFLEDTQIRIMEYALNLNEGKSSYKMNKNLSSGADIQIGPEDLAETDDPKVQRLMELYFEMETTLEDLRD